MASKKAQTIEVDKGFTELMGQIDIMRGAPHVAVGFFGGNDPGGGGEGLSIAEYMFVNEVGTDDGNIPPRPVMADTADAEKQAMDQMFAKSLIKVAKGKSTIKRELTKIGVVYSGKLKVAITDFDEPPNAPATIAQKGADNPLIDTGTARNAVTWELRGVK